MTSELSGSKDHDDGGADVEDVPGDGQQEVMDALRGADHGEREQALQVHFLSVSLITELTSAPAVPRKQDDIKNDAIHSVLSDETSLLLICDSLKTVIKVHMAVITMVIARRIIRKKLIVAQPTTLS